MDGPDPTQTGAQRFVESLGGAGAGPVRVAEHQRDPPPGPGFGRHSVDLFLLDQLQPMLDRAQEAVRLGQGVGVVSLDVAGLGQERDGAQRRAVPDGRVEPAVDELQQLHGELDVADTARSTLELPPHQSPALHL